MLLQMQLGSGASVGGGRRAPARRPGEQSPLAVSSVELLQRDGQCSVEDVHVEG